MISDHGGAVLDHVDIQLIFWDTSYWQGSPSPTPGEIQNAIQVILDSSYMSALGQYRGAGTNKSTIRGMTFASPSTSQFSFTKDDVNNFLNDLIENGKLPEPDEDWPIMYCVFMPKGMYFLPGGEKGAHSNTHYSDYDLLDSDDDPKHYAWILHGTLDFITDTFSHELVEILSDPNIDAFHDGSQEIGDIEPCHSTHGTVNGVLVQSYWSNRDNGCTLPGGFTRITHSGVFVQGTFGQNQSNFELVVPSVAGGLAHYWRNDDDPLKPWLGPSAQFAQDIGHVEAVGLIQSNFNPIGLPGTNPGNLEGVCRAGSQLFLFWRDPDRWNASFPLVADGNLVNNVRGTPAFIQSTGGERGNFELVVPLASGSLAHYWRDNDDPALPWHGPTIFGKELGLVDDVTMIQSTFGSNLEVVCRSGSQIFFFWRDSGGWNGSFPLIADGLPINDAIGMPSLIQSTYGAGSIGNLELIVPYGVGGLKHYWRDNSVPSLPWHGPSAEFGVTNELSPDIASMIESNYGNLEVVARFTVPSFVRQRIATKEWYHFSRDASGWHGPNLIVTQP